MAGKSINRLPNGDVGQLGGESTWNVYNLPKTLTPDELYKHLQKDVWLSSSIARVASEEGVFKLVFNRTGNVTLAIISKHQFI